jgi:hypothetical protein
MRASSSFIYLLTLGIFSSLAHIALHREAAPPGAFTVLKGATSRSRKANLIKQTILQRRDSSEQNIWKCMDDGADTWGNGNTTLLSAITNHSRVSPNRKNEYTSNKDLTMMRCFCNRNRDALIRLSN